MYLQTHVSATLVFDVVLDVVGLEVVVHDVVILDLVHDVVVLEVVVS